MERWLIGKARKPTMLCLVSALLPCLVASADGSAPQRGDVAKPDARYLTLFGLMHSTSKSMRENVDFIKKGMESGVYGEGWMTIHKKATQGDIDAFAKDVSVVIASKTPAEAGPSLKDIESLADKIHKSCPSDASPAVWKIALFLALSKDVQSASVASLLLKRVATLKSQALMAIDKANDRGEWSTSFEAKSCRSFMLVEAYRMGFGLCDMPKSQLMETLCFSWPGDDHTHADVESAKCKKIIKLAASAMNIVSAADGVVTAKSHRDGKVAMAALDKAVKTSIAVLLSPNGPSKPTVEASAQAKAICCNEYAELLEHLKNKSTVAAIQRNLEASAAKARR